MCLHVKFILFIISFLFKMATMVYAEVSVPQKFHPHIIGRRGANINKIKEETCTSISIPSDKEKSDIIRIEGDPQGVAAAKKIIGDMAAKLVHTLKYTMYIHVYILSFHVFYCTICAF